MPSRYGATPRLGLLAILVALQPPAIQQGWHGYFVQRNPFRFWTFGRSRTSSWLKAEAIFDEFRDKELMPAFLADADPNRALLDRRVICDLLGFDEDTYVAVRRLAAKWCAEPSVHGGKKRPKGATLVV